MSATRVMEKKQQRRRTWWALLWSLLVHGTVILLIAWIYFMELEPPPEPVEEIEITIVQPPSAEPAPPRFVDTSASEADKPPEQAAF